MLGLQRIACRRHKFELLNQRFVWTVRPLFFSKSSCQPSRPPLPSRPSRPPPPPPRERERSDIIDVYKSPLENRIGGAKWIANGTLVAGTVLILKTVLFSSGPVIFSSSYAPMSSGEIIGAALYFYIHTVGLYFMLWKIPSRMTYDFEKETFTITTESIVPSKQIRTTVAAHSTSVKPWYFDTELHTLENGNSVFLFQKGFRTGEFYKMFLKKEYYQ